jgi:hypothetical protein
MKAKHMILAIWMGFSVFQIVQWRKRVFPPGASGHFMDVWAAPASDILNVRR